MDDHGENIVFLARALLNTNAAEKLSSGEKKLGITLSFKALCLTTLLAAAGGALVTDWVREDDRPLNRYERFEVQALVFYAAKLKAVDEDVVRHDVAAKIGLAHFEDMTAGDFPAALRYLQKKAQ